MPQGKFLAFRQTRFGHTFLSPLACAALVLGTLPPAALSSAPSCGETRLAVARRLAAGREPVAVAVGDFNRDGRPDLATANSGDNTVSIFLGKGSADFAAAT
ncbi:MAG: FG-GAP repeat domain-containing protein, partial [Pyrinomonadaceae bacterium]